MCDMMPMGVCHILLGRPWKFDRNALHDETKNLYKFEKDGIKKTLVPLQDEGTSKDNNFKELLMSGKTFLQQMEEDEVSFALIFKPKVILTNTTISYFPIHEIRACVLGFCYIQRWFQYGSKEDKRN